MSSVIQVTRQSPISGKCEDLIFTNSHYYSYVFWIAIREKPGDMQAH